MGVKVYWLIVAAVIILGIIMPQYGWKRKYYIILMTGIHIFVCGFRYMYLTGDLIKYEATFQQLRGQSWFSDFAWQDGRNTGFQWLMKLVAELTDGDFQIFLFGGVDHVDNKTFRRRVAVQAFHGRNIGQNGF